MQVSHVQAANRRTAPRYWVRSPCALHTPDGILHGRLRDISAAGAFVEIRRGPNPGTKLRLEHPTAGSLEGTVVRRTEDGISLSFAPGEANVVFALQVISCEISSARQGDTRSGTPRSVDSEG